MAALRKAQRAPAGYSGTPLAAKLSHRAGQRALLIKVPPSLDRILSHRAFHSVRRATHVGRVGQGPFDYVHLFTTTRSELTAALAALSDFIAADGMIWVSWPKKVAKLETDVTEDVIREVALPLGLVDVKVCAIDETWSGLKLVLRKHLRARK